MEHENNKGRKPKYLTVERFERFLSNDWYHLGCRVGRIEWLLRILLGGLIVVYLIDKLAG